MQTAIHLDVDAIARACEEHGVERLRVFGSVLTDRFDPASSDVDFLVTFLPGREDLFHDYFEFKSDLERIVGNDIDLIMERAVKNPYFKAAALKGSQDVYAA
ncbi:nucleotidyltransferase domain-containing protein [Galactobacter sp.]|uniref:nucleotidyltransferase family protein n=1 Tax=Galactobacter sp. TaxID=2676125 RepID=UPI0025C0F47C|nr:nucleotidyltransferase domain-containing protein [Galactobacter sp.]